MISILLYPPPTPSIFYGSKQAARLLMTPMRDAMIQGPALREAHRRTGWYLAMHMADEYLDVEEFAIQHRNPGQSRGFRLVNESQTCIVAIMRGGEQMAVGVNYAFPTATLLHAKTPDDLDAADLSVYEAIILVDLIINTGTTMISMVEHIRGRYGDRRIVIVTGGVQAEVLTPSNELWLMLCDDVSLVTLPDPDDGE
jgi:uracil phosphoribosyltransferase